MAQTPKFTFVQPEMRMNSKNNPSSYLCPKAEGRELADKGGHGVFALEPIGKGETVIMWGGEIITAEQLKECSEYELSMCLQVDDELFMRITVVGLGDWINHSCDPNVGVIGQCGAVAMRDIEPGEELTFDYAMTDSSPYDTFECQCGTSLCRGVIRGGDWALPSLQERYRGHFSLYIQRKIDQQNSTTN
ncbi:SET domain-containing protein-lysine N-methyltransferase [Balamuthia mandrillaris]